MCDNCEHNNAEEAEKETELDKEDVCCGGNCEDCDHKE